MRVGLLQAIGCSAGLLIMSSCTSKPDLPPGIKIVAASEAKQMLKQCSRDAPEKGDGTWQPSLSDVRQFELLLKAELPRQIDGVSWTLPSERDQLQKFPAGFWREYVGITRQGRQYIYGNFGPVAAGDAAPKDGPTMICDGGPVFFGAQFETNFKTVSSWAFNGSLG